MDFEVTGGHEKGSWINPKNRLLLACWILHDGTRKSKWGAEWDQAELLADIAEADYIVAHSAQYELGWLQRCGLDLRSVLVYDTYLGEWVLGGNLYRQEQLSLDEALKRHGLKGKNPVGAMIKAGIDPINIPPDWLEEYCFDDVEDVVELKAKQLPILLERSQLHLVYARGLLAPVLVDIQLQGLTLDPKAVHEEYERVTKEHAVCSERLMALSDSINWRSPKQVAAFLYDTLKFPEPKSKLGVPERKANKETIAGLKATTKPQKEFVEAYKQLANLSARLSKNLNFFKGVCDHYDGTFYGILNQGTTSTHRLSSSGRKIVLPATEGSSEKSASSAGPQLQNIPREYKQFFVSGDPDWEMMEADGAQLEFRVAAELAQDPVAIDEIVNNVDVHSITASFFTERKEPTNRQEAKPKTFKPLFAGGSGSPATQAYCKFFQNKYSVIFDKQTLWTYEVSQHKVLITPYGMRFYWPNCKVTSGGWITHTTEIFNFPIQGFATAEIIPIALVWLWHTTKDVLIRLILTVHDSVIAKVHKSERERVTRIVAECFTTRVYETLQSLYRYTFRSVPLAAGIKFGDRWGAGTEVQAFAFPEHPTEIHWKSK